MIGTMLGTVKSHGFDANGYERRERLDALAECPRCGKEIECFAETECWTEEGSEQWGMGTGRWLHSEYGGAQGVCEDCGLLIADCLSDGFRVFDLSKTAKAGGPGAGGTAESAAS